MTARKRRPDSESTVYVGRNAAGTVVIRFGKVSALDADGEPIGTFKTDKQAMGAIIDAAKARPTLIAA